MAGIDIARKKMAKEDVDLIDQYTTGWNNAYAAGDKAGMDKYHQLAEGVRSKYNYTGGTTGRSIRSGQSRRQRGGRWTRPQARRRGLRRRARGRSAIPL